MPDAHHLQEIDAPRVLELLFADDHVGCVIAKLLVDVGGARDLADDVLLAEMAMQRAVGEHLAADEEDTELRG